LFDYRKLRDGKSTGLYYEPNTPLEERNYGFFSFMKEAPELGVLNFDIDDSKIVIRSIIKDSVAYELCEFRPGTVISKINGKPINEISREELLDPLFYSTVDNYTVLEENLGHTISFPIKRGAREIPGTD
jgi:C-terminal processing protease CtpA/Prc